LPEDKDVNSHQDTTTQPLLAPEGWPFVAASVVLALLVWAAAGFWWALPLILIAVFVIQFFRDPPRKIPTESGVVVSPADGEVVALGPDTDPVLDRPCQKISVFMNVFSVHSNRSPVAGTVREVIYTPGSFVNAALDKASVENERNALVVETDDGESVTFIQIAGLVARRILCYASQGDRLERGERYGFIRFGSRVDVYLPESATSRVQLGEKVVSGQSVLADLR